MELQLHFWVVFLLLNAHLGVVFSDQYGFLSLSCGGTTTFIDSRNIKWVPDDGYVNGGSTTSINYTEGNSSSTGIPARFFPDSSARNCYRLPVIHLSSLNLVRTKFMYQNYDGLSRPPAFVISLGRAMTRAINLSKTDPWTEEFIWPVSKDSLPVCFHPIPNGGYPVISSLEVRPLPRGAYGGVLGGSQKLLRKVYRINCGSTNVSLRYPVDPYDRIWDVDKDFSPSHLTAAFHTNVTLNVSSLTEVPPLAVLQTARFLGKKDLLTYNLPLDELGDYYIILYYAGVLPVSSMFNILCNGGIVQSNYVVNRSKTSIMYFTQKQIRRLNITFQNISFYPQVSAIEVFQIVDIPPETSSTTVLALEVIQQYTGLDLGWEDDPCFPRPWNYIACEGNLVTSLMLGDISLRSISPAFGDLLDLKILDLRNTSLTGEIQNLGSLLHLEKLNMSFNDLTSFGTDLESLVNLQVLDLKGNKLQGTVPDKLGALKNLHLLNLENNKLRGPLPRSLNRETLEVRTTGNLCLFFSTSLCGGSRSPTEVPQFTIIPERKHSGHRHMTIILSAVGGGIFFVALVSLLGFLAMREKPTPFTCPQRSAGAEIRNRNAANVFSYKEIKAATNNFKNGIGRGSYGSVYLGKLSDGKMVAVKVRFDNNQIGADSFVNEVCLLSQIRHPNLVCLEGFCHDSKQQILIYEYLPSGSLADNLYGSNSKKVSLSWVRRLKIAIDAAKGLHYLHNGSEPRIIHRGVKCSNILLDARMNAKVSDFGLSRQLSRVDATRVTSTVKGTAGYLDPEYYSTSQLTEKSDVYSFGVVLLELICGREPLTRSGTPDTFNLVLWAKPYLQAGVFEIVDESLMGNIDMESMKKVAFIASRCVERDSSMRPTIAEVLKELKDAYSIQLAYLASIGHAN